MARRSWMLLMAVLFVVSGCASDGGSPGGQSLDRLRQQARDALARYDEAAGVAASPASPAFVPVGNLTGKRGDWEPTNGLNERALLAGRIAATRALPTPAQPTGKVVWADGATRPLALISAEEALLQVVTAGRWDCPECPSLEATDARLISTPIQTTRGPATVPTWEYTLKGTAVRVTRVAVLSSTAVKVSQPSPDPRSPRIGLAVESATTTTSGRGLTVVFTGIPRPGSEPCGADYRAEAVESSRAVAVIITEHRHPGDQACPDIGGRRTTDVELAQPLGERAVLEVQQGMPVLVTITQ